MHGFWNGHLRSVCFRVPTMRREGRAGIIYVWIGLFEGVGEDGRAEWAVFLLLTKVRRFETITAGKYY